MELESSSDSSPVHVMLVSFHGQGSVGPFLRLGKLIASKGTVVTFVTTEYWGKKMRQANQIVEGELKPVGSSSIRFEFFDDGCAEEDVRRGTSLYIPQLEQTGRREVSKLVRRYEEKKEPVSRLINNPFVPWVGDVAEELNILCAVLWIQSCACFSAYYHYQNGSVPFPTEAEPELDVKLPCVPVLKHDEIGTVAYLKQEQMEEMAHGVLKSGLSFLWVIRPPLPDLKLETHVVPQELKEACGKGVGKIVEWCPQEQVLAHSSMACFVTHCEWNSTTEALTSGVPVVWFPQWGDQVTNAVYLIDVFKTGVRLGRGAADEGIVPREFVAEKLLEATVGEKAKELRKSALKWKVEAEAAVAPGGSSEKNIREFVEKLGVSSG
ncbi:unnamed protein product [Brassica oleracea]